MLRELAALLELRGGNKFKVRAFSRGAQALEAAKEPVEALVASRRLTDLPGIGVALASQIEEIHRTGASELLASLRAGLPSGVLELAQLPGVGLHALETLHAELGVGSLADLRAAAEAGKLRTLKGFGEKSEAKILAAIAKYETSTPMLLLGEGHRLAWSLIDDLADVPGVQQVELAGELRRGCELSAGVSLVVTADAPPDLTKHPRFASGTCTAEGCDLRLADGNRVRITHATAATRAARMIEATGDEAHLAALRARGSLATPARTEEELYGLLGLPWIPPELREGAAFEAPDDLVAVADVRGFVHCHTTWSDGKHSIEEMAREAEARGATFITITDHSKTAHYAGGLDADGLRRQWDEIARVQEQVGIRILRGTEADILADGALDFPDAILEQLDVIVASIHNRYKQGEDAMTARLLRAVRWPGFKIWGHPLGRLVTSRPPVPCRVEEVLDALAASRGAVEINGSPARLDLEPRWCRAARERGLSFVLSVDAHATRELDNLTYAVMTARRAGVRRGEVLNARDAAAFSAAVRPGGKSTASCRSAPSSNDAMA